MNVESKLSLTPEDLIAFERWETDSLLDKYTAYKERFALTPQSKVNTPWTRAIHLLATRQVEHLDSISELVSVGRPFAAYALLRTMYETHLSILLLGFHSGRKFPTYIDKQSGKSKAYVVDGCPAQISRNDLALRFHAFADYHSFVEADAMISGLRSRPLLVRHTGSRKVVDDTIAKLKVNHDQAVRTHGFHSGSNSWHPFRSAWHLQAYLWPTGRRPRFPRETFEMEKSYWRFWFRYLYKVASHEVHGSPYSLHQKGDKSPKASSWLRDGSSFDHLPLALANPLFEYSARAVAYAFKAQSCHLAAFQLEVSPTRHAHTRKRIEAKRPLSDGLS